MSSWVGIEEAEVGCPQGGVLLYIYNWTKFPNYDRSWVVIQSVFVLSIINSLCPQSLGFDILYSKCRQVQYILKKKNTFAEVNNITSKLKCLNIDALSRTVPYLPVLLLKRPPKIHEGPDAH